MLKQIYAHYEHWEDFKAGMYLTEAVDESELIEKAKLMLTDNALFACTLQQVFNDWQIAVEVNLSNTNCNRRAWLGQAACCYRFSVPGFCSRCLS
jgi:hypothetical protein